MKLSSSRLKKTSKLADEYGASVSFDKRLAVYDIAGSVAHVKMLEKQGILSREEGEAIQDGLSQILEEIKGGDFPFRTEDEDVHMAVEKRLTEAVGAAGGKLHTARSRNDQVALDIKLFLAEEIENILRLLTALALVMVKKAETHIDIIMPGYTHLQTAQPILFSHWLLAYFQMFSRDIERFKALFERVKRFCPLGAGALAGTTFPIDRHFTAEILGFTAPTENSLDSVSDRDHIIEALSAAAIAMMHLSRLSEEVILFSSQEFGFISLSDEFATGSSMMPQKKNPDMAELARGKTGRVYGSLLGLLTLMKGLPLAYNKDMQEDKEALFDALDTLKNSIRIFAPMLDSVAVNNERMLKAAANGYATATDLADYLVKKGLAFREAHGIVGRTVRYAAEKGLSFEEIPLSAYKGFSPAIEEDVYAHITAEASVKSRRSYGGTAPDAVKTQIANARRFLADLQ